MNNKILWDGTYLGTISDEDIIEKFTNIFEYWRIKINNNIFIAIIRKSKDYSPCLIDELKPLFGLTKSGTHYIKYKYKYIVLIKPYLDNDMVINEVQLNQIDITKLNDNLVDKIKRIYVFKDLLCLNKATDSSIVIRKSKYSDISYPLSLLDGTLKISKITDISKSTYLPETVFKKWIKDESPAKILAKMCNIYDLDKLDKITFRLKSEIENIVKRVSDDFYVDLSNILITKIQNRMLL